MNDTLQRRTLVHERRGSAMGTRFHLLVHGAASTIADELCDRLVTLEARWSRFLPNSEVSQLNSSPESFHMTSTDTIELVDASIAAWQLTSGAFDPTVLHAIEAAGYDRTFSACGHLDPVPAPTAAPGCATIELDHRLGMVRLGSGVGFDPGGIGKGFAADLLVADGISMGATGVMVNIGGDVVCRGIAPSSHGWVVAVREPNVSSEQIALIALDGVSGGAVVTSTVSKRTWPTGDGPRHHLIDPATGRCTDGPVLATVVAANGWYAEAVAKQLLVESGTAAVDASLVAALVIDQAGTTTRVGSINEYLR
ncbi:MAG: FAD:protein FMN transferase [Ilumatobacter sp.]